MTTSLSATPTDDAVPSGGEFDYVIVGAGSADCTLAARLSENPGVSVLLLEAGGRDRSPWIHVPAGYMKTLDMPRLNWRFQTEPDAATHHRSIAIPRGRVLGGTSSINAMLYVRGASQDYDGWAALGNEGWAWQDVLPAFIKSENWQGAPAPWRGRGGPLNTCNLVETGEVPDAVIAAAGQCGATDTCAKPALNTCAAASATWPAPGAK